MIRNYFKIAWRNLVKNKGYSFINIVGLATGMAVAMLIGLWVYDELSFDKYHQNYGRIAQVKQNQTFNEEIQTQNGIPIPLGNELRTTYGSEFKHVVLSSYTDKHILAIGDNKLTESGVFFEAEAPQMLSLSMLKGSLSGLQEPYSILLSESVAQSLFGNANPINKTIRIDDILNLNVTGVYKNLPYNSTFRDVSFMAPWAAYPALDGGIKESVTKWNNNSWQLYVQLADRVEMNQASAKIKNAKFNKTDREDAQFKPEIFLHPMSRWHLYSDFKNGVNVGGRIQYVWLFSVIGLFVLLLAAINFMNLSTARSEKRAKEVGVRKAVGSVRSQLIIQFFSESMLVVVFAFILSILLALLILPMFNQVADKKIVILLVNPWFWLLGLGFGLLTGLIAGSYPALYLSSFKPIKALKGTFHVGRLASLPRKVLVVLQFAISVALIIGTIIVFRQIQYAKDRPIGYNREGLLTIELLTSAIHDHFASVRNDLLNTGAILDVAESSTPTTKSQNEQSNFDWNGKPPNSTHVFSMVGISQEFGKVIGWQFKEGRNFSRAYGSDAMGFVINESAKKYMGLKNPVGKTVQWMGNNFTIIGVTKDMIMKSPYDPVKPTIFFIAPWRINVVNIKLKPGLRVSTALKRIEIIFKRYNPVEPFNYTFVDEEYAKKFGEEERIGKLASFFAILAIFISCLGLFGLASFVAEQRTKEIGVRKVLGASIFQLWGLLSRDFVFLVVIGFTIATPIAWYFLTDWLQQYEYRTEISWWIFSASGVGALAITLLTVSYQSIKAALLDPVKTLRSE